MGTGPCNSICEGESMPSSMHVPDLTVALLLC